MLVILALKSLINKAYLQEIFANLITLEISKKC
jgi:hypothetical protein